MDARVRSRVVALVAAMAAAGALTAAGPAVAALPLGVTSVVSAADLVAADQAAERAYVRRLASKDPRSTVRRAAWSALTAKNVDAAIVSFWATEYPYAVRLAAERRNRNADFAARVLETHTARYAPEVHAAAQRAVDGSAAEQDEFFRKGYKAAKERDRQAREATGQQAAVLEQEDRNFVARLRDTDPGPQVREAARFALRTGATADVVEFFAHDWASAAGLDLHTYRTRCADADLAWRRKALQLIVDARAAEKAALELSGEAAAQKRALAARAWAEAGAQAPPALVAWANAEQVALAQAANWQFVAQEAGAATSSNWQVIAGNAQLTAQQWAAEREDAAAQAAYWTDLLAQTRAGEERTRTTAG